jgi:hypothetical protein
VSSFEIDTGWGKPFISKLNYIKGFEGDLQKAL